MLSIITADLENKISLSKRKDFEMPKNTHLKDILKQIFSHLNFICCRHCYSVVLPIEFFFSLNQPQSINFYFTWGHRVKLWTAGLIGSSKTRTRSVISRCREAEVITTFTESVQSNETDCWTSLCAWTELSSIHHEKQDELSTQPHSVSWTTGNGNKLWFIGC